MRAEPISDAKTRQRKMVITVLKSAVEAATRLNHECGSACIPGCVLPDNTVNPSRMFRATADQVRAVRTFVKARLAGHPALEDAVLVASELAANTVAHSASGHHGGLFLVHLAEVSPAHAAILVCERRGLGEPLPLDAETDAEYGRGLTVVKSLTSFFHVFTEADTRSILAVVPAEPMAVNTK